MNAAPGAADAPTAAAAPAGRDRAGRLLVLFALAVAFLVHLAPVAEFDLFYHLAIGEWILDHHAVPRTGLFSATRAAEPWVDGEYGFQVLVALVHVAFGFAGLALLLPVLATLPLVLLARTLARRGLPPAGVALAIGLVTWATGPLTLRPQLLTLALLPVFLGRVLALAEARPARPDLLLALLSCLWANLHQGFILGLVTLAVPAVVEGVRSLPGPRRSPAPRALWLTLALAVALAAVNPYGFRQILSPLTYALHPGLTAFNAEWSPTVLAAWPGYLLLLGVAVASMALSARRPGASEVALLLAFAGFSLKALRHVPVGAIAVAAAASASAAGQAAGLLGPARSRGRATVTVVLVATLALGGIMVKGGLPDPHPLRLDDRILLPVEAADFLLAERPAGRLFNQYGFGGYLIWRFRPEAKVFVDGRNDLYGEEFMADYLRVIEGRPGFLDVLDRNDVGTVLVAYHPTNARLIGGLLAAGWVGVHGSAPGKNGVPTVVLVRNDAAHADLVRRLGRPLSPPG